MGREQSPPAEAMLVERSDRLLAAGLVRSGRLDDLVVLPLDRAPAEGSIVVGRVSRIAAGLDAAFLDIGTPQHALLRARDLDRTTGDPGQPIARRLHEGQKLAVKVVHPGYDDKGPRVIARTGAEAHARAAACDAGHIITHADPLAQLAGLVNAAAPAEVIVADTLMRLQLTQACAHAGRPEPAIAVDPDNRPLARFDALGDIELALGREVPLAPSGRLTFERTRALTVIDVDSGADVRDIATQNALAAREIARQLRIRNIAGVIVIDFIDARRADRQAQLEPVLRAATAGDRAGCTLAGFGPLGLFEMTRRRAGVPLALIWPSQPERSPVP